MTTEQDFAELERRLENLRNITPDKDAIYEAVLCHELLCRFVDKGFDRQRISVAATVLKRDGFKWGPKQQVTTPWVIVEQSEGLLVEVASSHDNVFFVDYDECTVNPEYVTDKLEELRSFSGPGDHILRITETLRDYPHTDLDTGGEVY